MDIPTEHDYIEKCKHLIECRLEWVNSLDWKNRDYEYLSELLFDKTRISISVSTLKRIWKNERIMAPHVSTLNALALFLDYENWNDFKTKLKNEVKPSLNEAGLVKQKKRIPVKPIFIAILGLIIISAVVISFTYHQAKKKSAKQVIGAKDFMFTSKKTITSGLPNTVVYHYDISKINFDSAFIQQDWDNSKRKKILKENHFQTCIYYYPGFYTAKLVINNQIVKTFPLFIETKDWMAVYKKKYMQEVPVYLKNINPVKNHSLYISVDDLKKNQIENDKDYLIGFYNARDFGEIYADNYTFETTVKNNPKDGGLTCQYTSITLQGKEGMMTASFCEKGCTAQLFLNFGNVYIDGSKNDLSAFGADLSNWRKIKYQVVNKAVKIYIDDKEIYQLKFEREIGKIIGIQYHFYGCGAVKEVKLFDKDGGLVYGEGFR